jgi:hypothetical protein
MQVPVGDHRLGTVQRGQIPRSLLPSLRPLPAELGRSRDRGRHRHQRPAGPARVPAAVAPGTRHYVTRERPPAACDVSQSASEGRASRTAHRTISVPHVGSSFEVECHTCSARRSRVTASGKRKVLSTGLVKRAGNRRSTAARRDELGSSPCAGKTGPSGDAGRSRPWCGGRTRLTPPCPFTSPRVHRLTVGPMLVLVTLTAMINQRQT